MAKLTGENKCFNCSNVNRWYANYNKLGLHGSLEKKTIELGSHQVKASLEFMDEDTVLVRLKCRMCSEINIFKNPI